MTRKAERLVVHGRVQGVGYRWWTLRQAQALDLEGWVRNRTDGTVEILAAGDPAALDALARACETGPPAAAVRRVVREPAAADGTAGFQERPTV